MIHRLVRVGFAMLLLSAPALAADRIELSSGRVVEGEIVREEKVWIGVETDKGLVWVKRTEIESLTRDRPTPLPTPEPAPERETETDAHTDEPAARKAPKASDPPAFELEGPERTAERERLLAALCSEDVALRVEALDWIVDTWPRWRDALRSTLKDSETERHRLEAVRILDDREIDAPLPLIEIALEDDSPKVRSAALRVARHRKLVALEQRTVDLMRCDPAWLVRQEAIRTLEDIGGEACLPHVMAAWSSEQDRDRKRRYRRVMKALLGDDFGDDAAAWFRAADELFMGDRVIRKGKIERADRAR